MKKIQNTIGGRIKINVGPWADVEAIVINDNLGVIFHAFSPKDEPKKIDEQFSTDDHQPFSKELNELWANVRKDEELKNLTTNPKFRVVLQALTIAKTYFPVLSEGKSNFLNGKAEREVFLYDDKGNQKEITFTETNFKIPDAYEAPEVIKRVNNSGKSYIPDYSLIPLRKKGSKSNKFYPLHDSTWEIEFDIKVVSTMKKEVVVLYSFYLMGKNGHVAEKLKNYEEKNKSNLKWEYSEILDYIQQNDYGSKTLQNLFDDKMKNIIADEIVSKYRKEQMDALSFDTEFINLKTDIEKILPTENPTESQLRDKDAIYEYIKVKILTKTAYNYEDLKHFLSNGFKNLLLKYTYIYSQWEQNKEKNVNELVEKYKKETSFTTTLQNAFENKLKGKTELKYKDANGNLISCKDEKGNLTECKHKELNLCCKDEKGKLTACKLNQIITKDSTVSDWIKANEVNLDWNNKKPTIEELSKPEYTKQFGAVDELYELAMSPKERAAYEYEKSHDISKKYIKVNTNQIDNFWGWPVGVNEVQFKFKRTLSEELRTKLTEVYNNTDVFQSKIVAKEKELEEKQKLLTESEENLAKTQAELDVQNNAIKIIVANNTYYKQLIQSHKAIVSKVLGKKITLFDDLDLDKIQNDKTEYKKILNQALELELSRADRGELEMLALGIEKYVNLDDDVSIKDGELKVANLQAIRDSLELKKVELGNQQITIEREMLDLKNDKKAETQKDEESKLIVKLSEHPRLALHPDWFDKETKKLKFPTLQDRVMIALKEFGK